MTVGRGLAIEDPAVQTPGLRAASADCRFVVQHGAAPAVAISRETWQGCKG